MQKLKDASFFSCASDIQAYVDLKERENKHNSYNAIAHWPIK